MKVLAKVHFLDEVLSGTSDNGNSWEKQTVVVRVPGESEDRFLAIEFMGERKTQVTKLLQVGQTVEVTFVIISREYQGKWYTRLDGVSIVPLQTIPQPSETK
mgnify:CR=1 FL=1